jgi:hypothetical protein
MVAGVPAAGLFSFLVLDTELCAEVGDGMKG